MLGILKLIFGLGFLAMAFGFGYLWGSQKSYSIQDTLNSMRSDLTSKIGALEHTHGVDECARPPHRSPDRLSE